MTKKVFGFINCLLIAFLIVSCSASPAPVAATTGPAVSTLAASPPTTSSPQTAIPSPTQSLGKQNVTFKSGDLTLVGTLYRPAGAGPFPAIVWHHGDEKDPQAGGGVYAIAKIFVPAGYVVF